MKMFCTSSTTGITYCPEDSIRIVNPKQILFYLCKGITIQDVFPSKQYDSGNEALVFSVDKGETREAYAQWQATSQIDPAILDGVELVEKGPGEVRILNLRQVIFYLSNGARLLGVYPMKDRYTSDPVLAFAFNKQETMDVYEKWREYKAGTR